MVENLLSVRFIRRYISLLWEIVERCSRGMFKIKLMKVLAHTPQARCSDSPGEICDPLLLRELHGELSESLVMRSHGTSCSAFAG